jgi:hypothetical protein
MIFEPTVPAARDLPRGRLELRRAHLAAEITGAHVDRRSPRLSFTLARPRVAAIAVACSLLIIGTAVAATANGWLSGAPAPQAVTSNFGSYLPQLGFTPQPGRAVLVAQRADVALFATANDEGGYCLIASAPWKRPAQVHDSGTCLSAAAISKPLIAGVVGASGDAGSKLQTFVVAGRTTSANAKTVRFADPTGDVVIAPVAPSGFFVVSIDVNGSPCQNSDWTPAFSAVDADGAVLSAGTVTLASSAQPGSGACTLASPHS